MGKIYSKTIGSTESVSGSIIEYSSHNNTLTTHHSQPWIVRKVFTCFMKKEPPLPPASHTQNYVDYEDSISYGNSNTYYNRSAFMEDLFEDNSNDPSYNPSYTHRASLEQQLQNLPSIEEEYPPPVRHPHNDTTQLLQNLPYERNTAIASSTQTLDETPYASIRSVYR